ncbi:rhamnulokinase family protein [Paenibacillus sp. J2TS4]|uniref:rhamnulokinase n=1 Tax=Paenibacillus sp. J2TS4 TaxID=2807194 RepID=UPI001B101D2A|nr:rhamnulokinase family protein [Paenibacillus sp. J2TS4]GIP33559.1 L-fuculose kinase [Paenibacillus sp. J2TS4]
MNKQQAANVLAFDLGASSGRAIIGRWDGYKLSIEEIHRFPNDPVQVGTRLQWDILRIFHEIKQGLLKAKQSGIALESMAIDSWAVDFGVLGSTGELLMNPYHYRDRHTDGIMDEVVDRLGASSIFSRTGIQFLPINTIYQLYALRKSESFVFKEGRYLLMIPDLLQYFLTGKMKSELTISSTTQLYNPTLGEWDGALLRELGIPREWFAEVVEPGTVVGLLTPIVCEELDMGPLPVVAVGEHDTASAVLAVPAADSDFAYLISGTWSLLGTEVQQPVLSQQALEWNFTNEGGVQGTYRLLKNIMGLWLLQECRNEWIKNGKEYSFAELSKLAEQSEPFRSLIDPDHEMFLKPVHMTRQISRFCRETGQSVPQTEGQYARCILESLALKYRYVFERTEQLADKTFKGLHMAGGGIQNTLLCQFTASAIGRPVWTGPIEASAIGNIAMQLIASGIFDSIQEARSAIRGSFAIDTYLPEEGARWEQEYHRFLNLVKD